VIASVLPVGGAIAAEGDQRGHPDRDRVRAERERLGHVGAAADAAGGDQLHGVLHADLTEGLRGQPDRGQGGNAGVLDEEILRGRGAALHAVDHHDVRARLDRQLDVVDHPGGAELHVDRLLPARRLTQLLDLDPQVVGSHPVRMAGGGALVDAGRQGAHAGDPVGHLLPEQQPAAAGFGALADDDLDGVGLAQVVEVEPVARRQALVDQQREAVRSSAIMPPSPVVVDVPTALAARPSATLAVADRAPKLMPAIVTGMGEMQRLAGVPGAQDGAGVALLPVPSSGYLVSEAVRNSRSSKVGRSRLAPQPLIS
jgi:hypothetical protein